MPKLTITQLDEELRRGVVRPIYVAVGPEQYLLRTASRLISEAAAKDGEPSKRAYAAKEVDPVKLIDELKAVSMFSPRTFVVIREGEKLGKDVLSALTSYAEAPVQESTLLIEAEKIDGRSKFMRVAEKKSAIVECKALYANQLPAWVNIEAKKHGKKISMEAARFLVDMVGNDLGQLAMSIERVSLYVGNRALIELKDIEEAVVETAQRTVFELGDAIGNRRVDRAMAIMDNLIENGQAPVFVLNMISRHIRILIKAREIVGRIQGNQEIARYLGVHPFFAKNYVAQSKNFSAQELRRFFQVLARCDRSLKSSRLPRERILEKLLFELCGQSAVR